MNRLVVPVATAVVVGVALVGCSSASTTTTASSQTTVASAGTTAPSPASAPPRASGAATPADGTALSAALADAMAAAKSGKMTLSMEGAVPTGGTAQMAMTSEFVVKAAGRMDMKATTSFSGQTVEMVLVDDVLYLKMAGLKAKNGAPWIKVDPKGTDSLSQRFAESMRQADPAQALKAYEGTTLSVVGSSGGVTKYQISGMAGTSGGEVFMWVDESTKLPVKSEVTAPGAKVVTTFSDWGAPTTIAAPPADQVGPIPGS